MRSILLFFCQANNKIIDFNGLGAAFKQFHSDKFNDLKDFVVSGDGKTIWLLSGLNGLIIYQISF